MMAEKAVRLLLGILVVAFLARYLGVEVFGQLNFSLAVLSIAVVGASVGMNRIVIREVTTAIADPHERSEIISTAFFLRLGAALVTFGLIFLLSSRYYEESLVFLLLVLASLFFNPFDVIELHQQGVARVKEISLIRTAVFLFSSLIKLGLIWSEAKAFWFFLFVVIEHAAIGAALYLFIATKNGRKFLSLQRFSGNRAVSFVKESWPEIIAGLGGILFVRLDQVMLQFMRGAESVGVYSAAVRISEAWYFIPTAIVAATFPKVVQLKEESQQVYHEALLVLFSGLVIISLIVAGGFFIFSDFIINILYGEDYALSALILNLHCIAALFIFLGSASGSWLAAEKKLILNLYRNIFGLVVNIIANLILIDLYGPVGAAIATIIAVASAYYIYDIFNKNLHFIFVLKTKALFSFGYLGIIRLGKLRS